MENNTIPTTIRQAFKILDNLIGNDEKKHFLSQSKEHFCLDQHEELGLWIRNNWIYENDDCYRMLSGMGPEDIFFEPVDVVSNRFLGKYYEHLKRTIK